MERAPTQADAPVLPLLIFDGECGFCTTSARWAARHRADGGPTVPWQHLGVDGLARYGLTPAAAGAAVWWVDEAGRTFGADRAVAEALAAGRGPWRALGRAARHPPLRWLGQAVYPVVARHRHRLPGGTPACRSDGRPGP